MGFDLASFGTRTALLEAGGRAHSYAALADRVNALGDRLHRGSVVLCLTRSALGAVVGYVACIQRGAVPILMDHQTPLPALLGLVAAYEPTQIWAPAELLGAFEGYRASFSADGYGLLVQDRGEAAACHEALALLLTTSGSTGSPKLVRISSRNLAANTASIANYLKLTPDDRTITTLPFNYSFGLSILNTYLHVGASIVLSEATLFQRELWDALREHRVTSLSGVPYTYEMLKKVRFLKMDLPALTTLTQAGGKLPVELCREYAAAAEAKGMRFFAMYGATEATARMAYLPPEQALHKAGSIGVAIPGGALELVGEHGAPVLGPGQVGELVYRGPNVSMGYAESRADLAKGDELGGVLATGDLAQRDDDGFHTIVGRTKRFIKLFGVRTNLDEAERLVERQFPGLSAACTGEDNRLVVHLEDAASCDAVRDYLVSAMRVTPSAITVRHVASLPRSASGKLRYSEL
jgi:long-chain acyl-CoA synthetase